MDDQTVLRLIRREREALEEAMARFRREAETYNPHNGGFATAVQLFTGVLSEVDRHRERLDLLCQYMTDDAAQELAQEDGEED